MKKLLNTLYVSTQGAYLSKEGESVLVNIEKKTRLRLPVHTLGGIVCFGNVGCSPFLLSHCAKNSVGVSFLTEYGRFLASVIGPQSGNVMLRREQYRRADDPELGADSVRFIITAKIANCRTVLRRALRDHSGKDGSEELQTAVIRLSGILKNLDRYVSVDELRGAEGDAARTYFSVFNHLITSQKDGFRFEQRNRRPPQDPVNALLSFVYTLLTHDVRSALEAVGLDPQVGTLHRDRPGRPGLALDLMEELRPVLADRLVLNMINLKKVKSSDFTTDAGGAVRMTDDARKTVLKTWQERKKDEITHPYLEEKIHLGLLPHAQALLFVRYLRNDIDGYPPFLWK